MPERPAFQRSQYQLTAHIRDPQSHPPPPGIEDRRLRIYRELLFNNVAKLLAKTFPVLHRVLAGDPWNALVRDYFARHHAHTPLFLEMPQEFLAYLENERGERAEDPPFLLELAHYEWVELALSIDEAEISLDGVDRDGDLLAGCPVVSPLAWPLAYAFPVHRISPDFQPTTAGEQATFLVVYRDLADKVGFIEINAVSARLLELAGASDAEARSGRELLEQIAAEMAHPRPQTVIDGGRELFERLRRHDVVLGTRH